MNLTNSQSRVINALVNKTLNSIESNIPDATYFKAPTGSGKTFMMLNYVDQLIEWSKLESGQKLVFVIVTLSSAELPKQMEESFKSYKDYLLNKDIQIERIESPSNISKNSKVEKNYQFFAKENHLYIMGGASFRKNSILSEQGSIESFLGEIRLNGYKLIYIRDEAHIGAEVKKTNQYEKNFEEKMQNSAHFIVKMTATPKTDHDLIELTEREILDDKVQLLKNKKYYNKNIEDGSLLDNEVILQKACEEFKIIKEKYNDNINEPGLVGINPAMLIQVDNDSSDKEKSLIFDQNIDLIIKTLEKNNLSWVKYFDQNNKDSNLRHKANYSLRDISKDSSPVDVIIFKVGPATGWNIPRACMLVQLRHISSSNLSIQTIGRIKRNPFPGFDFNETSIAKNYYLYSNVNIKEESSKSFILKEKFVSEEFISGSIELKYKNKLIDEEVYSAEILKELENKNHFNKEIFDQKCMSIKNQFKENGFIINESKTYGKSLFVSSKIYNLLELEIYNKKSLCQFRNYLTNKILEFIWNFYDMNLKEKINKHIFWFIFIKRFGDLLKETYNKQFQKEISQNSITYKLDQNNLLPAYMNDYGDLKNIIKSNEEFAYRDNLLEEVEFRLDSNSEKLFVKELKAVIRNNKNVKVWSKNPVNNGVNFQYITSELEVANSYPDFLIKSNDHFVYLEIKTYNNDIDEEKTKKLYQEYLNYIKQNKNNNIKLTLCICLVEQKNDEDNFYFAGASTITSLNEKLQETKSNSVKLHDKIKSDYYFSLNEILSWNK
ncbi:DEAD/DEAH box helicase family protein [Mycoplasmopsis canis]|nr:DEAD/DEAH box helicase family protein [Mycoplasmopsis cynos]WQQ13080.1 DEAD/DEAH box helicase family protein [Mycoplasmopsis cynos]